MKASTVATKAENKSTNSLVDRIECKPDIPKQIYYQKLLSPNAETNVSFTSDNSINRHALMMPSNNLLSPELQKEAADYLFQSSAVRGSIQYPAPFGRDATPEEAKIAELILNPKELRN